MYLPDSPDRYFTVAIQAIPVQSHAFELLEVELDKLFPAVRRL